MKAMNDLDLRSVAPRLAKQLLVWLPIFVGIAHQILMVLGITDRIYVFVDPPGYISPAVSVEYQWWIVLTLITGLLWFLVLTRRLTQLPVRVMHPLYIYLLYLLILVKPI